MNLQRQKSPAFPDNSVRPWACSGKSGKEREKLTRKRKKEVTEIDAAEECAARGSTRNTEKNRRPAAAESAADDEGRCCSQQRWEKRADKQEKNKR